MGYGLNIYNNNSEIQVDSQYKNFSLHATGSWSIDSSPGLTWYNFPSTPNEPILAIQPSGTLCMAGQYDRDSNYEYYRTKVWASSNITLPYIIFTESELGEIPSGAYGLAIYNQNEALVFHNHNNWCRIHGATIFSNPLKSDCSGAVGDFIDITVNDAYSNYFILRPLSEQVRYDFFNNVTRFACCAMKRIDSTTIRVEAVLYQQIAGQLILYCRSSQNLTLIEVSVN